MLQKVRTNMNTAQRNSQSHHYTVRLWLEDVGDDCWEWRGMVKHLVTGEERYFRDWSTLRNRMLDMLPSSVKGLQSDDRLD
jgi:hypothetical protein